MNFINKDYSDSYFHMAYINTVLVALSTAALGTSLFDYFAVPLLVLSVIYLLIFSFSKSIRNAAAHLEIHQIMWMVALILFSTIWFISLLRSDSQIDSFERPAKLAAGALITFYLCKVGIKRWGIILGLVLYIAYVGFRINYNAIRTGLDLNPNAYAYLTAIVSLSLLSYSIYMKLYGRVLIVLISGVGIAYSMFSGTRGLVIVFALYGILNLIHFRKSISAKWFLSMILLAILACIFITKTERVEIRISNTIDEIEKISNGNWNTSIGVRLLFYRIGISEGLRNPLFGSSENVQDLVLSYTDRNADLNIPRAVTYHTDLHNQYIDSFARRGIFGLLSLLFMLIIPYLYVSQLNRPLYFAFISTLGGAAFVDSPLASGNFLLFMAITVSAIYSTNIRNFKSVLS